MPTLAEYTLEKAGDIVGHVAAGERTVLVHGGRGSGRSMVLEQTARTLAAEGFRPVLIAPPARHMDSASMALLECGVGLSRVELIDNGLSSWTDKATFTQRRDQLRTWLESSDAGMDELVLLCDDPQQWTIPESGISARRAEVAADLLLRENDRRKVVVGRPGELPFGARIDVDVGAVTASLLEDQSRWRSLAPMLEEVRGLPGGVADRSPVDLGFLVAHAALFGAAAVSDWWTPGMSGERIAERLVAAVARTGLLRPLWNAWLTAAIPRRDVPRTWLENVLDTVPAGTQQDVLNCCLLFGEDEVRLAREARTAAMRHEDRFVVNVDKRESRRFLSLYAEGCEEAAGENSAEALIFGAEALYMASRLGDTGLIGRVFPKFSDQMNAIGTHALEHGNTSTASEAFEIAIETDDEDAFAHHHLGFALDTAAQEPRRAESEYRLALALDCNHAAWHARLISLLVVRARDRDAQEAWEEAIAALTAEDGSGPSNLYAKLHLPVAADLLRRNRLQFARIVLDDIPSGTRPQLLADAGLRQRLKLLQAAEVSGSFVPARRALSEWWREAPELLAPRASDGRELVRWIAAQVADLTDSELRLGVAVVEPPARPETGTLTLSQTDFQRLTADVDRAEGIAVGDFLEFGFYDSDDGADPVIRVLRREDWPVGLPTLLDPARYLRRRGWT